MSSLTESPNALINKLNILEIPIAKKDLTNLKETGLMINKDQGTGWVSPKRVGGLD